MPVVEVGPGPGGLTLVSETEADGDGLFALGFSAEKKLFLTVRADGIGVQVAGTTATAVATTSGEVWAVRTTSSSSSPPSSARSAAARSPTSATWTATA